MVVYMWHNQHKQICDSQMMISNQTCHFWTPSFERISWYTCLVHALKAILDWLRYTLSLWLFLWWLLTLLKSPITGNFNLNDNHNSLNAIVIIVQPRALMHLGHLVRANSLTLFSRRIPEGEWRVSVAIMTWFGLVGCMHGWIDEWELWAVVCWCVWHRITCSSPDSD